MHISHLDVEDKIIEIRKQHVIIDSDVAQLYGVETKRINEAVGVRARFHKQPGLHLSQKMGSD